MAPLGETFRLLGLHLHLFTLISLTVWLPGHLVRNYVEFFGPAEEVAPQSLKLLLAIQVVFEPLVVSATIVALDRITQGLPVTYLGSMTAGLAAWGRLLLVRFVINCAVALPALAGMAVLPARAVGLAAGGLFAAVLVFMLVLLLRYAVVDSVVVLEGATALTAWRRAASLTAGRRWAIFRTAAALFALVLAFSLSTGQALRAAPELNHFVVRVLLDCVLAVSQSVFTIALFLFYRQARADLPPASPAPA